MLTITAHTHLTSPHALKRANFHSKSIDFDGTAALGGFSAQTHKLIFKIAAIVKLGSHH